MPNAALLFVSVVTKVVTWVQLPPVVQAAIASPVIVLANNNALA